MLNRNSALAAALPENYRPPSPRTARFEMLVGRNCAVASTSGRGDALAAARPHSKTRSSSRNASCTVLAAVAPLPRAAWFQADHAHSRAAFQASDALLMGTGCDAADSGAGSVLEQADFGDAVASLLLNGGLPGDRSLGDSAIAQAARVQAIFAASGVRRRGAQRPASSFFRTTAGCPDVGADPLLQRMQEAAQGAIEQWVQRGGEGVNAITHIVVGSLTPPRSAPGAFCSHFCSYWYHTN